VPKIVQRCVVLGTDLLVGNVDTEKDLHIVLEVLLAARPSPPEILEDGHSPLNVFTTSKFTVH
jgi:hypothetical protein